MGFAKEHDELYLQVTFYYAYFLSTAFCIYFMIYFIPEFEVKLKESWTLELSSVAQELEKVVCISRGLFLFFFFLKIIFAYSSTFVFI